MIFLGLGLDNSFFGPLSDSFGGKPIVYIGLYLVFASIFVFCSHFGSAMNIWGNFKELGTLPPQGTISIIYDKDLLRGIIGKNMSFVTAFFILVPIVAPRFGKFFLDHYGWSYFYMNN